MTAAVAAAGAGHQVTVIERRTDVGGQVRDLARLPYKEGLAAYLAWLARECARSGAELRFEQEANPAAVLATRPDIVVLAAGHVPLDLGRHADPGRRTLSCSEVLRARVFAGRTAAIVGAGREACETAEWLAMAGMTVTLVAPTMPGRDLGTWTRWPLLDRLEVLGVTIVTGVGAVEVAADQVRVERIGDLPLTVRASVIVRATGWTPASVSEDQLGTLVRVVIARGDPAAEDGVGEAVRAGLRAVRAI
jgi:2,4-dienoyl-CoA reductase (NADPH2)